MSWQLSQASAVAQQTLFPSPPSLSKRAHVNEIPSHLEGKQRKALHWCQRSGHPAKGKDHLLHRVPSTLATQEEKSWPNYETGSQNEIASSNLDQLEEYLGTSQPPAGCPFTHLPSLAICLFTGSFTHLVTYSLGHLPKKGKL